MPSGPSAEARAPEVAKRLAAREKRAREEQARAQRRVDREFFQACLDGDAPRVVLALERGANLRRRCEWSLASARLGDQVLHVAGRSALMLAAMSGSVDCVELLLARGADAAERLSPSRRTALACAAEFGSVECFQALARAAAPSAEDLRRGLIESRLRDAPGAASMRGALEAWAQAAELGQALEALVTGGKLGPKPRL